MAGRPAASAAADPGATQKAAVSSSWVDHLKSAWGKCHRRLQPLTAALGVRCARDVLSEDLG